MNRQGEYRWWTVFNAGKELTHECVCNVLLYLGHAPVSSTQVTQKECECIRVNAHVFYDSSFFPFLTNWRTVPRKKMIDT